MLRLMILMQTHFKQTESFLHTHFTSCHPPNVKKEFVKGEALRILRKNSSETTFEKNNSNLKKRKRLTDGGYPQSFRGTQPQFSENICSRDDLRSRIFRNICCKISCLSAPPRIFEHLILHDPPLAQGSKLHDPPPLCSGPPRLYFLTSP